MLQIGGLGPDVYQLFIKGQGIFCNPASKGAPAKLRLLYEVAPIGFLVEAAGGRTSHGSGSVLDLVSAVLFTVRSFLDAHRMLITSVRGVMWMMEGPRCSRNSDSQSSLSTTSFADCS